MSFFQTHESTVQKRKKKRGERNTGNPSSDVFNDKWGLTLKQNGWERREKVSQELDST
jgi:hypothetical protein